MEYDIDWVINRVKLGQYQFRKHAAERASERGIDPLDVKEAILNGEIIECYPRDPRGYSLLICGKTEKNDSLHIVCGCLDNILWIITVYEPDPEEWVNSLKRMKQK